MQDAEKTLSILTEQSAKSKNYVFKRLYRNLFKPNMYLYAYNLLYSKKMHHASNAHTQTVRNLDMEAVNMTIELMKQENYYPKSLKSKTQIQAQSPSFQDILVQEIIKLILESIYEPIFEENSHGFRRSKTHKTALTQIQSSCENSIWVIKGDISDCLDSTKYPKLLDILGKKIKDGRFIELTRRFLKCGYLSAMMESEQISEMFQGQIIAPILINIYLHEFDLYVKKIISHVNIEEKNAVNIIADEVNPKINYIRYANSWLICVDGSKDEVEELKKMLKCYLNCELDFELPNSEIKIMNLNSEKVRFLRYDICKRRGQANRKIEENSIQLLLPREIVEKKIQQFSRNKKPLHRADRLNQSVLDTLIQYNSEISELYDYYSLASDMNSKLRKFRYFHYQSLLKTIASKEKSTVARVMKKYALTVRGTQGMKKIFAVSYEIGGEKQFLTYFNSKNIGILYE